MLLPSDERNPKEATLDLTITSPFFFFLLPLDNGEVTVLPAGKHEFPFSFQLPEETLVTSFEGKHGSIRYWVKVKLHRPWATVRKIKKEFTVIEPIDINTPALLVSSWALTSHDCAFAHFVVSCVLRGAWLIWFNRSQAPQAGTKDKMARAWYRNFGQVSVTAKIDRKGYTPGESSGPVRTPEENSLCRPSVQNFKPALPLCRRGDTCLCGVWQLYLQISGAQSLYHSDTDVHRSWHHEAEALCGGHPVWRYRGCQVQRDVARSCHQDSTCGSLHPAVPHHQSGVHAQGEQNQEPLHLPCTSFVVFFFLNHEQIWLNCFSILPLQVCVDVPGTSKLCLELPLVIGTIPLHPFGSRTSSVSSQYSVNLEWLRMAIPEQPERKWPFTLQWCVGLDVCREPLLKTLCDTNEGLSPPFNDVN